MMKVNLLVLCAALLVGFLLSSVDVKGFNWLVFHPERPHYSADDFLTASSDKLFEGWYYKIASEDQQFAIIPGAYHSKHESYTFIMFVTSEYSLEYRYPLSKYVTPDLRGTAIPGQFHVEIDGNIFNRDRVQLNLESSSLHSIQPTILEDTFQQPKDFGDITAEFNFSGMDEGFPVSFGFLGAMGYYGWLPMLECYHGILAMNFNVSGWVKIRDSPKKVIENYSGYLEKDWGTNFPQTWIWLQASSFKDSPKTSLTLALARLPIIGDSVLTKFGFLGGFYHKGELHQFGTYTWATVDELLINDTHPLRTIKISVSNFFGTKKLIVSASVPLDAYKLKSKDSPYPLLMVPSQSGRMLPQLIEWVNATIDITFIDGNEISSLSSTPATVECHSPDGNMDYMKDMFS